MDTPFYNDPLCFVWMAFQRLYPDKKCKVAYDAGITDDDGKRVYGLTTFCNDGEIFVTIDAGQAVCNAVETLAHELAHVAVGPEKDHDGAWKSAFDAIYDEYVKIGNELIPDCELVKVEVIGETVKVNERGGEHGEKED